MPPMRVMCRVRPFSATEAAKHSNPVQREHDQVTLSVHMDESKALEQFALDDIFWQDEDSQDAVYSRSAQKAVDELFDGFNCCVFAYGQTGSGKTYTMMGTAETAGVIPRFVDDVFTRKTHLEQREVAVLVTVTISFFEIYGERVRDLLIPRKEREDEHYSTPRVRQHPARGVYVEGLVAMECATKEEVLSAVSKGAAERATAGTRSNATSSRSHAVFQISVRVDDGIGKTTRSSTASLVDLAGSERVKRTGATGTTLEELKSINQSLSALRRVLEALDSKSKGAAKVVPYRDSVLTHVLSEGLNGNSFTLMFAMVSPLRDDYDDTITTLRFAAQARRIVLNPKANVRRKSVAVTQSMENEINQLRRQLTVATAEQGEFRDELKETLASREAELQRILDSQQKLEHFVKEYEMREREMTQRLNDVTEERDRIRIVVSEAQRQRFANAFRMAFAIAEKKKPQVPPSPVVAARRVTIGEVSFNVNTELRDELEYFRERVTFLEEQLEVEQAARKAAEAQYATMIRTVASLANTKRSAGARTDMNHHDPRLTPGRMTFNDRSRTASYHSPAPTISRVAEPLILDDEFDHDPALDPGLRRGANANVSRSTAVVDEMQTRIAELESGYEALLTELWRTERTACAVPEKVPVAQVSPPPHQNAVRFHGGVVIPPLATADARAASSSRQYRSSSSGGAVCNRRAELAQRSHDETLRCWQ